LRLRREDYTETDIDRWAGFVSAQQGQWQEAFIYFKHEASGVGPQFAQRLMEMLGVVISDETTE
jgi:uncharacterized protein YecE (DUF72 family)